MTYFGQKVRISKREMLRKLSQIETLSHFMFFAQFLRQHYKTLCQKHEVADSP